MASYFHSVQLDEEKCRGCTNCIKRCPTEAIRVRQGKARIEAARCVDCGQCIRACPNRAKSVLTDSRAALKDFKYTVGLLAPSFFAQFRSNPSPGKVLAAVKLMGFTYVRGLFLAAELVASAIAKHLATTAGPFPRISTSCPAVVRLIQVRFPDLTRHLVTIEAPMEVAAYLARAEVRGETGCGDEDIGVFFITPCPAKITAVHQPVGVGKSQLNGGFSFSEVYADAYRLLASVKEEEPVVGSARGLVWARSGGEGEGVAIDDYLAVDGIEHVITVLEEVEMGRLRGVRYIEGQACVGGCVGGALVVENPFVARVRVAQVARALPLYSPPEITLPEEALVLKQDLSPRPFIQLDEDMEVAIKKLGELEKIVERLPMLDCGSCGAPHCRALAEDIVRDTAVLTDCDFVLREQVNELAQELISLTVLLPNAMGRKRIDGEGEK
ncbi:MAG: Periplasmic (Fe) hydrogenase large subunit [Firmicutes bacterium]|nr:Periplasmic (Fe) hydrogenase large subunit [Bacillota bacterium]